MASSSGRKSGSSGRSTRKRVVIGAEETVRVRYDKDRPHVESERRSGGRRKSAASAKRASSDRSAARAGKRLASTKRDERSRRQQLIRLRRVGIIAGALVVVGVLVWGGAALYSAPIFSVRKVEVEGNRHLSDSDVRALARVPRGATLLRLPRAEIERNIEKSPWVVEATAEREFPGTVRLVIEERVPGALIDTGGAQLWVVSRDGVWLSERSAEETGLVVVRDIDRLEPKAGTRPKRPEISNALKVIAGLSAELREQVRVLSAPSVEQTSLVTEEDVEIFVGEADRMAKKDQVAREILRTQKGKVVYINVRVVDSPTWRGL